MSGNALRSSANIEHNDEVDLNEGKQIELNAIPGSWTSDAWWVEKEEPEEPDLPDNASGLSGKWTSDTNPNNYFEDKFPEPDKPEWNGDISQWNKEQGLYNIDYTNPTSEIYANIGDTTTPTKTSKIAESKWYGGPGYEQITVVGNFSDTQTTSYNKTGDKSGIWDDGLVNNVRVFGENLVLDSSPSETKTDSNNHYGTSQVYGPEELSITSTYTGVHTSDIDIEDFATNTNDDTNVYLLDNTKPTITYTGAGEGSEIWTNVPFTIGMLFKDKDSGLNNIDYRLENEERDTTTNEYLGTNESAKSIDIGRAGQGNVSRDNEIKEINTTININKDGEYYLYLDRLSDPVGNNLFPTTVEKGPYKYDGTRPSVDLDFKGRSYTTTDAAGKTRIEYIADRENKIYLEGWDNISGIQRIEYALIKNNADKTNDGEGVGWTTLHNYNGTGNKYINVGTAANPFTEKNNPYKEYIEIDTTDSWKEMKSDWYYLHLRITDRAGNVTLITGTGATDIESLTTQIRRPTTARYNAIPIFINKVVPENMDGFKIADIADPRWKATLEGEKYIPVREMPAYNNTIPHKINLGYRAYFEIYTTGYGHFKDDNIIIGDRLFINTPNGYKEVQIYLPKDKYASKYEKATDWTKTLQRKTNYTGGPITETGVLTTIDFAKEEYMWIYDYYIRPDAKFVKVEDIKSITPTGGAGDILDLSIGSQSKYFIDPKISPELLVLFQIDAYKTSAILQDTHLDYTKQDDTWGNDPNNTSYGNKKPTGKNLIVEYNSNDPAFINGDPNHGETFWYDLQNTLIDDLDRYTN